MVVELYQHVTGSITVPPTVRYRGKNVIPIVSDEGNGDLIIIANLQGLCTTLST